MPRCFCFGCCCCCSLFLTRLLPLQPHDDEESAPADPTAPPLVLLLLLVLVLLLPPSVAGATPNRSLCCSPTSHVSHSTPRLLLLICVATETERVLLSNMYCVDQMVIEIDSDLNSSLLLAHGNVAQPNRGQHEQTAVVSPESMLLRYE